MSPGKLPLDGSHEDRSPQPSLVDRDRLASLRNDLLKRPGTFNNRISPARPPPPDDAPILQARVSIPDSAPDRQQWLKQQSTSRRRRRRSSKSAAGSPQDGRGRRSSRSGSENHCSSRDSSLGGGESDASASSADSRLSIASTPEASGRQRQLERHQSHRRFGSSERTGSAAGPRADRSRRSSHGGLSPGRGLSPSMLPSARAGQPGGGSLSRNSSSSSLSTAVSSSSLGSQSLRWCGVCEAEFTRLRRPHRCRRCLEAVCAPCSPARLPVPGAGSLELKRACKLCAGRSSRPQVDVVASPRRRKAVAAAPAGTQRRAASMGSMIRAPLGVFSGGVAAAVKYTAGLYPAAAPSGAVGGAEHAANGGRGGLGVGAGDGGESSEVAGRSNNGQGYLATRIAAGGLAALGKWGAGIGMSPEKPPPEEPSASIPAAEAEGAQDKATSPGDEDGANAGAVGTDVAAVEAFPQAAEELSAAPTPAAGAVIGEAEAPASEEEAGDEAVGPGVAGPLPGVDEEAPTALGPVVGAEVADAKAPASDHEAAKLFRRGVAGRLSEASTPAGGAWVAEAKAAALENEAGVVPARTGAAEPPLRVGERLCSEAEIEDAWTMVDGESDAGAPIEAVGHVGDTFNGTADEPEAVSGGDASWVGGQVMVGSREVANTAATEEKDAGGEYGIVATEDSISARSATVQAAERSERTLSEAVVDGPTTSSSREQAVSPSPLRRALRFVRRLVEPHVVRLCKRGDVPPQHGKESVADLLPVLKAGSPIALEYCTAFGIDAAAWLQTAQVASESYRVIEEQAKMHLARRRARQ